MTAGRKRRSQTDATVHLQEAREPQPPHLERGIIIATISEFAVRITYFPEHSSVGDTTTNINGEESTSHSLSLTNINTSSLSSTSYVPGTLLALCLH